MATKKSAGKVNPKVATLPWFGIMLDYELEVLLPDYWPVRAANKNRAAVDGEFWIVGNPVRLPTDQWIAELRSNKGLADRTSREVYTGGVYRFRRASEDEV